MQVCALVFCMEYVTSEWACYTVVVGKDESAIGNMFYGCTLEMTGNCPITIVVIRRRVGCGPCVLLNSPAG